MALLELYPIVVSCVLWGDKWNRKRILFHCDNMYTVQIINKGRSKVKVIMKLLRRLTWCAAKHNFTVHAQHLPGKLNSVADALSRFQMDIFRNLAPQADFETNTMLTTNRISDDLKEAEEDLWNYALSPGTLSKLYKTAFNQYLQFVALCNLTDIHNSLPVVSEEIMVKFVLFCAKVLSLKWSTIKIYLAGIRFHYIKAGVNQPFHSWDSLHYILNAVRRKQGTTASLISSISCVQN